MELESVERVRDTEQLLTPEDVQLLVDNPEIIAELVKLFPEIMFYMSILQLSIFELVELLNTEPI